MILLWTQSWVSDAAGGAGTQPGGCLALVGVFAEVDVPAVVAALADDLGQDEGDPRVLPLRDCLERTHIDQLEQVPPQLPYLRLYGGVQAENQAQRLHELQIRKSKSQVRSEKLRAVS